MHSALSCNGPHHQFLSGARRARNQHTRWRTIGSGKKGPDPFLLALSHTPCPTSQWWGSGNEATFLVCHLPLSSKKRNEIGEKRLTVALQSGWLELLPVGGCGQERGGGDKVREIGGRLWTLESKCTGHGYQSRKHVQPNSLELYTPTPSQDRPHHSSRAPAFQQYHISCLQGEEYVTDM